MSGKLYFVVGPSGSGKDSLISYAKTYIDRSDGVVFARRFITRPPDGRSEQHIPLNKSQFLRRAERGDFLMCWQAHGLCYAVDKSVLTELRAGFDVVVHGSRAYLGEAQKIVPSLVPVVISADEDVLKARLLARGSEDRNAVAERIERARKYNCTEVEGALYLKNDGKLCDVGRQFCQMIAREHANVG